MQKNFMNNKKISSPIKQWAGDLNRYFITVYIQMTNNIKSSLGNAN